MTGVQTCALPIFNDEGEIFLSHTKLDGRFVLRLAIGNARTSEADVALAWEVLRRAAAESLCLFTTRSNSLC